MCSEPVHLLHSVLVVSSVSLSVVCRLGRNSGYRELCCPVDAMQFTQELLEKLEVAEKERDLAELDASELATKLMAAQAEVRGQLCSHANQRRTAVQMATVPRILSASRVYGIGHLTGINSCGLFFQIAALRSELSTYRQMQSLSGVSSFAQHE